MFGCVCDRLGVGPIFVQERVSQVGLDGTGRVCARSARTRLYDSTNLGWPRLFGCSCMGVCCSSARVDTIGYDTIRYDTIRYVAIEIRQRAFGTKRNWNAARYSLTARSNSLSHHIASEL
mmetsp:Transcript_9133/g.19786  ORF Transcript_9133/g.19786 Transcript_9133/m.19786 type:complete len:120 (+) Transcript_9133:130-489(+)